MSGCIEAELSGTLRQCLLVWCSNGAACDAEWTDFWGTIVNYQDGAAPSTNRRLHRHLLQVYRMLHR